jgi:CrcB protein
MGRNIIFVALGGMLGSVGRFLLVSGVVTLVPTTFPLGTFIVNIAGCFAMGAAVGIRRALSVVSP